MVNKASFLYSRLALAGGAAISISNTCMFGEGSYIIELKLHCVVQRTLDAPAGGTSDVHSGR